MLRSDGFAEIEKCSIISPQLQYRGLTCPKHLTEDSTIFPGISYNITIFLPTSSPEAFALYVGIRIPTYIIDCPPASSLYPV